MILIPVADPGYTFSSWSGANGAEVSNTALGYNILMDGNKTVQANFVLDTAITHNIPLAAGWNLVSFNVAPVQYRRRQRPGERRRELQPGLCLGHLASRRSMAQVRPERAWLPEHAQQPG